MAVDRDASGDEAAQSRHPDITPGSMWVHRGTRWRVRVLKVDVRKGRDAVHLRPCDEAQGRYREYAPLDVDIFRANYKRLVSYGVFTGAGDLAHVRGFEMLWDETRHRVTPDYTREVYTGPWLKAPLAKWEAETMNAKGT